MKKYLVLFSLVLCSCVSDGNQNYNAENGGVVEVGEFNYYDDNDNGEKVPMEDVKMASLAPIEGASVAVPSKTAPKHTYVAARPTRNQTYDIHTAPVRGNTLYVQAGAFSEERNARRLVRRLQGLGEPHITATRLKNNYTLHRVSLKVNSMKEGKRLISQLKNMGIKAFMVKR